MLKSVAMPKQPLSKCRWQALSAGKTATYLTAGMATRAVLKRFVELVIIRDTAQCWKQNDNGKWLYYKDGKAIIGKQTIGGVSYTFNQYGESDIQPQYIFKTYTVQKGDSFWKIALEYNVNMFTLAKVNGKSIFSLIYEGEELKIPN